MKLFAGDEDFVVKGFELDSAELADLLPKLLIPIDKSEFGDIEFGGDGAEAFTLGAQFDEFVPGFVGMHKLSSAVGRTGSLPITRPRRDALRHDPTIRKHESYPIYN